MRDFNFNYVPSLLSVKADGSGNLVPSVRETLVLRSSCQKPTISIFILTAIILCVGILQDQSRLDFMAVNNARVDEPFGRLTPKRKKIP